MHDLACEFVKVTLALKIRGIVTSATATESADGILHQVRPGTAVPWLTILIYISGTMQLRPPTQALLRVTINLYR